MHAIADEPLKRSPHIVIVGAGYGGLVAALHLQKLLRPGEANVTLVNKHDYHYITTRLHMPAAGTDTTESARVAISRLIDPKRIRFVKSTVRELAPNERLVRLDDRTLAYDYLVVGLGGEPETFGIPGLNEHALNIRSLNSVRLIREHIEYMFAKYKREPQRTDYLTFVVGGAGFTGAEFVGELADRLPKLCRQFDIDPALIRMYCVEASPKALPPDLPQELVEYGMNVLLRKGVVFKLSTPIRACTPDGVLLGNGEFIKAGTIVWAGGVRGNRLLEQAGFETVRGRVEVDAFLRAPRLPDVFVVGDCSLVYDPEGRPHPPSAQLAVQQGEHAARVLTAVIRGKPPEPFVYDYKGTIASLGRGAAVGVVGKRKLKGHPAMIMKRVVDARYLYKIGGLPLVLEKAVFRHG